MHRYPTTTAAAAEAVAVSPGTVGVRCSTCTTALASYFGVASTTYSRLSAKKHAVPARINFLWSPSVESSVRKSISVSRTEGV